LAGCRIGLFGRGGGGKSTCTVLLARALEEHRGEFAPAGAPANTPG
jgi:ABC-type polysaccharide/polyol phosphate transport system ATPase subunit